MHIPSQDMSASVSPGGQRIAPYAWFILFQAFLTTALVSGVWFSFAVFFVAMVEEFHWSRAEAALAFSAGPIPLPGSPG